MLEVSSRIKLKKHLYTGHKYPCVPAQDQMPVNLVRPDPDKGPWIAGGAALRWYNNQPLGTNDIDVFCRNETQAKRLIERLESVTETNHGPVDIFKVFESENAVTFLVTLKTEKQQVQWRVQIITAKYYNTMQEVVDNFDISVCQIATCGHEWHIAPGSAKDIHERKLRFNRITPQSVKRLTKYWSYGYTPVPGTIEAINDSYTGAWDFRGDNDYDQTAL